MFLDGKHLRMSMLPSTSIPTRDIPQYLFFTKIPKKWAWVKFFQCIGNTILQNLSLPPENIYAFSYRNECPDKWVYHVDTPTAHFFSTWSLIF